jgi:hypothetical protein
VADTHELHIQRGVLINDDPQRRCYDGCYFKSHIEWDEWEHWMDYPSEEHADHAARLFSREGQRFKVVVKHTETA